MISGFLCILYLLHYDSYHLDTYGNYSQMRYTRGEKKRTLSAVNKLNIIFSSIVFSYRLPDTCFTHYIQPRHETPSLRVSRPNHWELTSQPMQANLPLFHIKKKKIVQSKRILNFRKIVKFQTNLDFLFPLKFFFFFFFDVSEKMT